MIVNSHYLDSANTFIVQDVIYCAYTHFWVREFVCSR